MADNIYHAPHLRREHLKAASKYFDEQSSLLKALEKRDDIEAKRLKRYLILPDLTRLEGNPIKTVTDRVLNLPSLVNLDLIETPEIIPATIVFDLFNFPKDHPARGRSDTYFVDKDHILRPHTSLMWKYYLELPAVKERLEKNGSVGVLC